MYITSTYLYKYTERTRGSADGRFQHHSYHITQSKIKQSYSQSVHFDSLEIVQGESNNFFKKILGGSYDTACAFWKQRESYFC